AVALSPCPCPHPPLRSFPTRRSSDLQLAAGKPLILRRGNRRRSDRVRPARASRKAKGGTGQQGRTLQYTGSGDRDGGVVVAGVRSEEHTSELQSRENLVCRLLLEKKN